MQEALRWRRDLCVALSVLTGTFVKLEAVPQVKTRIKARKYSVMSM